LGLAHLDSLLSGPSAPKAYVLTMHPRRSFVKMGTFVPRKGIDTRIGDLYRSGDAF